MSALSPIYEYKIDLTGTRPENKISKEKHAIKVGDGINYKIVVPTYGGFFAKTVEIRDENYNLLKEEQDYVLTYKYEDASLRTGQDIMGAIIIISQDVRNFVYFEGNIVGGDYAFSNTVETDVTTWLKDRNNPIPNYGEIIGVATKYSNGEFRKQLWKLDGYEKTTAELETIRRLEILGDIERLESFGEEFSVTLSNNAGDVTEVQETLDSHINNKQDPHQLTPGQLDLDPDLQNFPLADANTDVSPASDEAIATPAIYQKVVNATIGSRITDHINDKNLPHKETAAQLGGLTKPAIDGILSTLLPVNTSADSTNKVDGYEEASIKTQVRSNYRTDHFKNGVLPIDRIGLGTASSKHILTSDGNWTLISDLFSRYERKLPHYYYHGYHSDYSEALSTIAQRFSDMTQYPAMTTVWWRATDLQMTIWDGNQSTETKYTDCLRAAQKQADGSWLSAGGGWANRYYGSSNYWNQTAGFYTANILPGTYSLLLVGGGGGGNGGGQNGSGGGGSGYATKTRITIRKNDKVTLQVANGGSSGGWTGNPGGATVVWVNDREVARANGGEGGQRRDGNWGHGYGGNGGSGGGGSCANAYHGKHNHYLGTPGRGGSNGNGGNADGGTGHNQNTPGGAGAGGGYYSNILRSIDASTTHGFDPNNISNGGGGWMRDASDNYGLLATRAGGGGGMGTTNFGDSQSWLGSYFNCTGSGFGAGGGGNQRGVSGLVSMVRIKV